MNCRGGEANAAVHKAGPGEYREADIELSQQVVKCRAPSTELLYWAMTSPRSSPTAVEIHRWLAGIRFAPTPTPRVTGSGADEVAVPEPRCRSGRRQRVSWRWVRSDTRQHRPSDNQYEARPVGVLIEARAFRQGQSSLSSSMPMTGLSNITSTYFRDVCRGDRPHIAAGTEFAPVV